MTIAVIEIINEVRRVLQDEGPASRYTDATIRATLKTALATARRLRPDMFIGNLGVLPSTAGPTLPIDEQFISPLVFLTSGTLMVSNDEFLVDGTAQNLMKHASNQLTRNT